MLRSAVQAILKRDLAAVRRSVEAYPDDASIWEERPGLPNVGGTLVLHLAGNLQHFVGAALGKSGYKRDRDAEFSARGVPRSVMLAELDATDRAIDRSLAALPDDALAAPFPLEVAGRSYATGDFLLHLTTHLAYHLGQLDYHRRAVTRDARSINAVAVGELPVRTYERAD